MLVRDHFLLRSGAILLALFQRRSIGKLNIKEMYLLISLGYVSPLVNPYRCVFHLISGLCRLVDSDVDREYIFLGFFLEAKHKFTILDRTYE